jgi:phage terminase large subunit
VTTTSAIVTVPYRPRPLQRVLHRALDEHRFVVAVCHRRWGKSVMAVNALQKGALTCRRPRPRFAYIAPTYRQGKSTAWDFMQHFARPIPGIAINQQELRIDYPNSGQVRIYGSDNEDALRGIYLDGVVFDEYGMQSPRVFSEVVRPALADREGWALFIGTPNGKNQFYDVAERAKSGEPGWAYVEYKASDTGVVSAEELAAARSVMTPDEYAQEFECSFQASVRGAIYATELEAARAAGRLCAVPYDPTLPVDTDWDLGVGDATAIWFSQSVRSGEIRLIDYYEASGEGLPFYAQVLRERGYTYGAHWAPHDIRVRELGSGRSRLETATSLGIKFQIVPNIPLEDGIHAVRMLLPRCWFDATKTKAGLETLQHYRRDYNTRLNEFKATPMHDWAEHGASAFRYLAVRHKTPEAPRPVVDEYSYRMPHALSWMS